MKLKQRIQYITRTSLFAMMLNFEQMRILDQQLYGTISHKRIESESEKKYKIEQKNRMKNQQEWITERKCELSILNKKYYQLCKIVIPRRNFDYCLDYFHLAPLRENGKLDDYLAQSLCYKLERTKNWHRDWGFHPSGSLKIDIKSAKSRLISKVMLFAYNFDYFKMFLFKENELFKDTVQKVYYFNDSTLISKNYVSSIHEEFEKVWRKSRFLPGEKEEYKKIKNNRRNKDFFVDSEIIANFYKKYKMFNILKKNLLVKKQIESWRKDLWKPDGRMCHRTIIECQEKYENKSFYK